MKPSLGPVFGVKGGAAGGGYAQVVPMEDINLHFTGDLHAIGTANNLLAAMIDNSIQQGNPLNIDPRRITWKRCMDMNDRQLRFIVDGLGGKVNGTPREDGFDITVASEVMAIFCLATSISDLKERLSKIVCAYTYEGKPVTAGDIGAAGAMTALLKDALDPNLVQTLENNPAIIHGGPFANIAHGCNSVMATKLSLSLADYVITEAGFGADLGAEKFLDIKCRYAGIAPSACVLVATVRALKSHGGVAKADLNQPNLEAVKAGASNLVRHIDNLKNGFGLPVVVAINAFPTDTPEEQAYVEQICAEQGVPCVLSEVFAKGGEGGKALAREGAGGHGGSSHPVRLPAGDAPEAESGSHRQKDLPCRRCEFQRRRFQDAGRTDRTGLRRPAGLYRQDPVQLQRQRQAHRCPHRLYHGGEGSPPCRRCRFRGGHLRQHYDHARPAQEARRRQYRRGCRRQDHGAVLMPHSPFLFV